ncbi:MAG: potassium channel protein [FCB group bacterium]|nr:potassium channel protein [FCB group bacterium]
MNKRTKFLLYLLGLICVSTIGYYIIGGKEWSLVDALYMTVITLTTVGFGEVHELTAIGKLWSIMVIIFGVSGLSVFLSQIGTDFIEFKQYRKRIMRNKIEKLKNHFIICGFGRTGTFVARELYKKEVPFVVIDNNLEKLDKIREHGFLYLEGDVMFDDTLIDANIQQARGLVITLDNDQDNLFVTMSARNLNKDAYIISRCIQHETGKKLKRAGADKVVNPYIASGQKIAELLMTPEVEDAISISAPSANLDLLIEQFKLEDMARLDGIMIKDSRLREDYRLIIVGVIQPDGEVDLNPDPHTVLTFGQTILIIGSGENMANFKHAYFD